MRLLHVTAQKPDSTGSGTYLAEVVAACGRRGHSQAVVCGIDRDDIVALPQSVSVYPVRFRTESVPFPVCGMSDDMPYQATRYRDLTSSMVAAFEAAFTEALLQAVNDLQPDAIICHHLYLLTSMVRELFADHTVVAVCHSTDLRQLLQHPLERDRIIRQIQDLDAILALHEEQKRQIIDLFSVPESLVRVIGTGYNADLFNSDGLPFDRPRSIDLLYVGKICRKKGVVSLLRALEYIDASQRRLVVRLIGGMGREDELATIAELVSQSSHDVRLLGRVEQDELVARYRDARSFVLPSFFEGLPLVVVEAMACGCNVLVTDLPGVRPWLDACLPEVPVEYVELPRMKELDLPCDDDVTDFEARLATGVERVLALPPRRIDTSHLSWDGLALRLEALLMDL